MKKIIYLLAFFISVRSNALQCDHCNPSHTQQCHVPQKIIYLPHVATFGSNQITERTLNDTLCKYALNPEDVVVVCLRSEPHIFLNGNPIYLMGHENNPQKIVEYEQKLVVKINEGSIKTLEKRVKVDGLIKSETITLHNEHAETEYEIVNKLNVTYIRLPNQDLHIPPMSKIHDFIHTITPYLGKKILMLHCHKGKGRTGFYAMIIDIVLHAHNTDFETILQRTGKKINPKIVSNNPKQKKKREVLYQIYKEYKKIHIT